MKSDKSSQLYCEIRVEGALGDMWTDWFAGLQLTQLEGNETLLSGPLPDQAALHGLLERIRDLNLTLISVTCGRPSTQYSDKESSPDVGRASAAGTC